MKFTAMLLAFAIPTAAVAHQGGHDVRGTVTAVSGEELTVKTSQGSEEFALTAETEFVRDGSPSTARELKANDRVVVHSKKKNGRMEAVKVQFATPRH
jgi:uncharacterized protein DUF5666